MKNHNGKYPSTERRQQKRTSTNSTLQCSDGRYLYSEFLCNLSIEGMCIEASKPLEQGTRLTISLSSKPLLEIEGLVKWTRKSKQKHRIGVRFVELTPEHEFRLKEIMNTAFWE